MPRILGRRLSRWIGRGIVGSLVLVGACEHPYPTTGVTEAPVQLRITAVTAGTPISTLVVAVTASDIPTALVFNLSVVNGVASGTIKIPPGPARTISVTAVDAQGSVTHDGSVTIDVKPGQNPPVQIKLRPRSGQVPITVTFGNFGVVVTPATATIDASVTKQLQLAVIVTDVDGKQIAAPQVGWATTQPAIATVDGTGLVTGIANGTATLVATYEGVAGLSTVNVSGIVAPPQPQPLGATDYYVAFPPNIDLSQTAALSLSIAGSPAVKGTVSIPGLGFSTTFATDATGLAIVPLPNSAALDAWDAVEPRGVLVHSEDSVEVLAISDRADVGSMAPTEVPPAQALGSSYYIMSAGAGSFEGSLLAIVGTADVTKVTISPAVASGARPAGSPFQIALNRGDAYQLEATGVSGDLTGTLVQSDKPIAVFGGHMEGQVPAGTRFPGMLWAAVPPAPAVTGTHFFALPFAQRNGYWLRVLALQSGTQLTTSGIAGLSTSMVAGQLTEARTTTGVEITSNLPILVAQLAEGNEGDAVPPGSRNIPNPGVDPCFALLHPVPAVAREYVFSTPNDLVFDRFVNIVAPFPAAVGNIALNGNPIDPSKFTQISLTFGAAVIPLESGVNRLTSNLVAFSPTVYGWNDQLVAPNGFCFSPGTAY